MKIGEEEAFLIVHKWQVEQAPIVLVGSLMPSSLLRGRVAVVTREGIWNSSDKPASIWGFSLTGKETNFLASNFEGFEYLKRSELPSDIKTSLQVTGRDSAVLALTGSMKLTRLPRATGDPLASVEETLFLMEDHTLNRA